MPIQRGKDLLISLDDDTGGYTPVAGLRTKSFSLSSGQVDVTSSDHTGWRQLLEGGGLRQLTVSGTGLFFDEGSAEKIRAAFFAGELKVWRLTVPGAGTFTGAFQVTNLDYAGEYKGEASFSITLTSAEEVTFASLS